MAFKALSKEDNKIYDFEYWEKNKIDETPYCPICGEVTKIKALGSTEVKSHFWHKKGSDCPSIEENHAKYALLSPMQRDNSNAIELKKWVKVNFYLLYKACKRVNNNNHIEFKEFKEMINKANNSNIWYFKGLTRQTLPHVLLVNFGMFKKLKNSRKNKFYYIFNKNTKGNDLFLQEKITHIWTIIPQNKTESDFERIEIDYSIIKDAAPYYFWDALKDQY